MAFKIAEGYVEIEGRVDDKKVKDAAKRSGDSYGKTWNLSATKWMDRFHDSLLKAIPTNWITFLPIVTSLTSALVGLAGAAFNLVSSLGFASLSLAAILPAGVALGGMLGTLMLLFKDMESGPLKRFGEGLTTIKDRLREAAFEGKDTVKNLNELMDTLTKRTPIATDFVRALSTHVGAVARQLNELVESDIFRGRLESLLGSAARGAGNLANAIAGAVDILVTLGAAAGPVFERFTAWVGRTIDRWRELLDTMYESGRLTDLFRRAGDEASKWGQIVFNLLSGLIGLFAAAAGPGRQVSDALLRISQTFREWSWDPATQEAVTRFMNFLATVDYQRIFELAASIMAVGVAIKLLAGVTSIVQGLLGLAQLGPVGLVLAGVAVGVGLLAGALIYAYNSSEKFRQKVNETFTWIRENVLPILQEVWVWFEEKLRSAIDKAVTEALPALERSLDILREAWVENKDEIKEMIGSLKTIIEFMIDPGIPVITRIAATLTNVLATSISWTVSVLTTLDQGLHATMGVMGDAANTAWSVAQSITDAWSTVMIFMSTLPGRIWGIAQGMFDGIKAAAGEAVGWVRDRMNEIVGLVQGLPGRVAGIIPSMIGNIRNQIGGLLANPFGRATGGIVGQAAGGGVRSGMTLVGEQGPELVRLPAGSHVSSNPDTRRRLRSQTATPTVTRVVFEGDSDSLIATLIMRLHREGTLRFESA